MSRPVWWRTEAPVPQYYDTLKGVPVGWNRETGIPVKFYTYRGEGPFDGDPRNAPVSSRRAPCGTANGYLGHRRRCEDPCEECKAFHDAELERGREKARRRASAAALARWRRNSQEE